MSAQQSGPGPQMKLHAPYPPKTAALGGAPTKGLDIPITAVYLVLFIGAAVGHMTIFQLNYKKGHKFAMSGMCFGFCMARITTCVMRIVWACYPTDVSVSIAAQIFVTAGVVILFVVNLIFAQRIVRAAHPNLGWHKLFSVAFVALYVVIVIVLIMLITATVQLFYTLSPNIHRIDRDIQLFGSTFYAVVSFLPIPLIVGGLIVPRKTRLEKFGTGRWRTKIATLLVTSSLLCLGAAFRTGTNFKNPRPRANPAWYQSKACFYVFDLGVEIVTIYLYLALRIDRRFHVPNGSKGPGDYSGVNDKQKEGSAEGRNSADKERGHRVTRVMSEEEVFDDEVPEDVRRQEAEERAEKDKEMGL